MHALWSQPTVPLTRVPALPYMSHTVPQKAICRNVKTLRVDTRGLDDPDARQASRKGFSLINGRPRGVLLR